MQKVKNETKNNTIQTSDNNQKVEVKEAEANKANKSILSGLDKKTYWWVMFLIVVTFGIFYFYLKHEVDKKCDAQKDKSASKEQPTQETASTETKKENIKDASNLKQSFDIPFDVNLFISHFGGSENITKVENSLSTIQVYVDKKELVKKELIKELLSGKGISTVEKKFSIVCGDYAESLKNAIVKILSDASTQPKSDKKVTKESVQIEEPIKEVISDKEEAEIAINKSEDSLISVKVDVNKIQKKKQAKSPNTNKQAPKNIKPAVENTLKESTQKEVKKNLSTKEDKNAPQAKSNNNIQEVEFKQSKNIPFDIYKLVTLFGGWVNIDKVENSSASSIQIYVFDKTIVKKDDIKALMSAKGIMLSDKKYSIICGSYAADLKNDLQRVMEINKNSTVDNVKMAVQQTK